MKLDTTVTWSSETHAANEELEWTERCLDQAENGKHSTGETVKFWKDKVEECKNKLKSLLMR